MASYENMEYGEWLERLQMHLERDGHDEKVLDAQPLWDYWSSGYSPMDAAEDIVAGIDDPIFGEDDEEDDEKVGVMDRAAIAKAIKDMYIEVCNAYEVRPPADLYRQMMDSADEIMSDSEDYDFGQGKGFGEQVVSIIYDWLKNVIEHQYPMHSETDGKKKVVDDDPFVTDVSSMNIKHLNLDDDELSDEKKKKIVDDLISGSLEDPDKDK